MSQDVRHGAVHGLQQVQHFLRLFVKERLVDFGEIARLKRVEGGLAL